jgi:hypothetical protein
MKFSLILMDSHILSKWHPFFPEIRFVGEDRPTIWATEPQLILLNVTI